MKKDRCEKKSHSLSLTLACYKEKGRLFVLGQHRIKGSAVLP